MTTPNPRRARPEDYALYVRAHAELRVPDPPRERERWARDMLPSTLFFEENSVLVAYAFVQILRTTGYVRNIVVESKARNRGIGRAVMRDLRERFAAAGCKEWCLNVKPTNLAAIRVYEGVGMRAAYSSRLLRIGTDVVARLPAAAKDCRVEPLVASEDDTIERQFGIEAGLLTARRASPEVRQVVGRDASGVVGVASYDVGRTAVPFAATSLGAAKILLEALQLLAAGSKLQLVPHANPELDRALIEAGADLLQEVVHYRGSV